MSWAMRPRVAMIADSKIRYLPLTRPCNAYRTPLAILGNLSELSSVFQHEIELIAQDIPVYLVEYPPTGKLGESADFQVYAYFLKAWMDQLGIARITPLAIGENAMIGHYFACLYPERTYKLILGGMDFSLEGPPLHLSHGETLVLVGEFDSSMNLKECFQIASRNPQNQFIVLKGVGALSRCYVYEKRDVMARLYRRFLKGRPLNRMKDIDLWSHSRPDK